MKIAGRPLELYTESMKFSFWQYLKWSQKVAKITFEGSWREFELSSDNDYYVNFLAGRIKAF